jgi:predicted small lipoprotein YifL
MRQSIIALLLSSLLTLVAGCGQTGPLYLSNTAGLSSASNASDKPATETPAPATVDAAAPQAKEGQ